MHFFIPYDHKALQPHPGGSYPSHQHAGVNPSGQGKNT